MTAPIPIQLVVEDTLSEVVARKILSETGRYVIGICYGQTGSAYIRKNIHGFNSAARGTPFFVLTDQNAAECAPRLISTWLPKQQHPNMIFRVAVHEIEAWLLAHRYAFAHFAGIRRERIPQDVDSIDHPKEFLIGLIKRSRFTSLKRDVVPPNGSSRTQGAGYNSRLVQFVTDAWSPSEAMVHSASLRRAISAVTGFKPTWPRTLS